jgi:hypothetical protein
MVPGRPYPPKTRPGSTDDAQGKYECGGGPRRGIVNDASQLTSAYRKVLSTLITMGTDRKELICAKRSFGIASVDVLSAILTCGPVLEDTLVGETVTLPLVGAADWVFKGSEGGEEV